MRTRVIKEGHDWHTIRRALYILMAFFNGLLWLVSLSYMDSLSDLKKSCMDDFLTEPLFRIVHTLGRAAMLAYRLESTLLFWKFYNNDLESLAGVQEGHEVIRPNMTTHTEIGKGRWSGGFLAVGYCGVALGSLVMSRHHKDVNLYGTTAACIMTSLTIVATCIRLQYSGSLKDESEDDPQSFLENISEYLSGDILESTKLLVFYSIAGITYHTVYALHLVYLKWDHFAMYSVIRQASKALACIFLAMFGVWMNHKRRILRKWRALHIMLWMIFTMLFLDLAEECVEEYEYGMSDENTWILYIFPLAIDFKMFILIHAMSDLMAAKTEYLIEQERGRIRERRQEGQRQNGASVSTRQYGACHHVGYVSL